MLHSLNRNSTGMPDAGARHLMPYAHALWNQKPHFTQLMRPEAQEEAGSTVLDEARRQRPVLITRSAMVPTPTLYLPEHWQQRPLLRAAAAHACAHLTHGDMPQSRGKLKPIQLALAGALEDARVEALAIARLPGLRDLWLTWHVADANSGNTFEALLQRVQRCLLDPRYSDPHAWVRKACALYRGVPMTSAGMRQAASLLGNDIGQLRMQFNARLYVVEPAYRDDNAHLWASGPESPPSTASLSASSIPQRGQPKADSGDTATQNIEKPAEVAGAAPTAVYGEWDRISRRIRPRWCQVYEVDAPAGTPQAQQSLSQALARHAVLLTRLKRALQQGLALTSAEVMVGRAAEGDRFHLNSLVRAAIHQRLRRSLDPHIYLYPQRSPQRLRVLVLLDSSVSTLRLAPFLDNSATGATLLEVLREAALLSAAALEHAGHYCAVQAFASNTRQQVRVQRIKGFDDRADSAHTLARLAGVQGEWSTRMGAALRHACEQLRGHPRAHVLLLTDGQPHDVDVHDSRYLLADLQHAAKEARRRGVAVSCINVLDSDLIAIDEHRQMQRALGANACRAAHRLSDLPHLLLESLVG